MTPAVVFTVSRVLVLLQQQHELPQITFLFRGNATRHVFLNKVILPGLFALQTLEHF